MENFISWDILSAFILVYLLWNKSFSDAHLALFSHAFSLNLLSSKHQSVGSFYSSANMPIGLQRFRKKKSVKHVEAVYLSLMSFYFEM